MTSIVGFLAGISVMLVLLLLGMWLWWAAGEAEVENDRT
jgi:hypothetical protein